MPLEVSIPIDVRVTYDEYKKDLFRQGELPIEKGRSVPSTAGIVNTIFTTARKELEASRFDRAFVLFTRCLFLLEHVITPRKDELSVKHCEFAWEDMRRIFKESLTAAETLIDSWLPKVHAQIMADVTAKAAERDRIIALQMEEGEKDEGECKDAAGLDTAVTEEEAHERRRQQLLAGEIERFGPAQNTLKDPPTTPTASTAIDDAEAHSRRQKLLETAECEQLAQLRQELQQVAGDPRKGLTQQRPTLAAHAISERAVPTSPSPVALSQAKRHQPTPQHAHSTLRKVSESPAPRPSASTALKPISFPPPRVSPYQHWHMRPGAGSVGASAQGRRGLVNLGNTCYLNSVLQCLNATPVGAFFRSGVWLDSVVDQYTGGGRVAEAFTYIMKELVQLNVQYAVSPSSLKSILGQKNESFAGQSQQDATELLQTLVDALHEDLNANGKNLVKHKDIADAGSDVELAHRYWATYVARNRSVIVDLLAFQERSVVVCPSCAHASRSFSTLMNVQVPIPAARQNQISINDCLAEYCAPEILDSDSMYKCSHCNTMVRATKQLGFMGAPRVLVISLKRFKSYGNFSDKISVPVMFQQELDFAPYTILPPGTSTARYNLVGIVNHRGNLHGGHYTADVRGSADNRWFHFSDEAVKPSDAPAFSLAYILFYVKCE